MILPVFITVISDHDKPQPPGCLLDPESWRYLSYRNELRSGRSGSEMQSQALREEPFYRLMTE
ncbi:hypothetical protein DPV23_25140 [Escherichia coli]|nr:hypothetical protein [Escherichia coli]